MEEINKVSEQNSEQNYSPTPSPSPKLRCFKIKCLLLVKYVLYLQSTTSYINSAVNCF